MIYRFITFCFIFCFLQTNANAFLFKKNEKVDDKQQKTSFYNENKDVDENNVSRKSKNYSKIGFEDYSQKNIWQKVYVGVDVDWWLKRLGDNYKKQISNSSFWRRFENFDVYAGMRIYKYFGTEIGYTHIGNFIAKDRKSHELNGAYASAIVYSPAIDVKYTSIEGYLSLGGALLGSDSKVDGKKMQISGKFGCGLIFHVYSSVAVNVGLDYYMPFSSFAKNGFLAIKTGVNLYLNI